MHKPSICIKCEREGAEPHDRVSIKWNARFHYDFEKLGGQRQPPAIIANPRDVAARDVCAISVINPIASTAERETRGSDCIKLQSNSA